jgi:hypothetical protein
MPEFPSDQDTATKSDKAVTIGLTLAGIVAVLSQTSEGHPVIQPSTQSMADDNTKVQ